MKQDTPPASPGQQEEEDDVVELDEEFIVDEDEDDYENDNGFGISDISMDDEDGQDEMSEAASNAPKRDDSELVFSKHTGSVFCCHLEQKMGCLAVTGGEDEKAYVWKTRTGEVEFECTGHNDSVIGVEFNHDGSLVATGDMGGLIQVWKISSKSLLWSENISEFVWLKWHKSANVLLAGTQAGEVYLWKVPTGECKVLAGNKANTDCGAFLHDGKRAVICYANGIIKIYDLKTSQVLHTIGSLEGHSGTVSCIDIHPDNNLIVTGGEFGQIVLTKTQTGKVASKFECDDTSSNESSNHPAWVEAVCFSKDANFPLVVAATLSGNIFIWDYSKLALRHKISVGHGISRLLWDPLSTTVYAADLDGAIQILNARTGEVQAALLGHSQNILDICLSSDSSMIISASDDKTARLFAINAPER